MLFLSPNYYKMYMFEGDLLASPEIFCLAIDIDVGQTTLLFVLDAKNNNLQCFYIFTSFRKSWDLPLQ